MLGHPRRQEGPARRQRRVGGLDRRHREAAESLLASGHAYRCYATPDELTAMREAARAEGRPLRYDGRWRDRDPADAPAGVKPAIRLKAPLTGETVVEDQVQGRVTWQNENLDDFVLLRNDGTPAYNLAVVVDDAEGIAQQLDSNMQRSVDAYRDPWQDGKKPATPGQFRSALPLLPLPQVPVR